VKPGGGKMRKKCELARAKKFVHNLVS
jgi:hypothetical protein